MRRYINKVSVTSFVLGVVAVIFFLHAYTVYQVRATIIQNSTDIINIANFVQAQHPDTANTAQ